MLRWLCPFALAVVCLFSETATADYEGRFVALREPNRRFQVMRRVASGAQAHVYEGHNVAFHERVAIKLVHQKHVEGGYVDTFDKEVELMRLGQSPTLMPVLGLGELDGSSQRAIVMPWLEAQSLRAGGIRPLGKSVRITMQVLRALRQLHAVGLRHNDLHVDNVLIEGDSSPTVKVIDLGIAVPITQSHIHGNGNWTTPEREQAAPQVNSDLYSAGAILQFLLTAHSPQQQYFDALPPMVLRVGEEDRDLRDILRKSMHPEPEQRYQRAQDFIDALRPFSAL